MISRCCCFFLPRTITYLHTYIQSSPYLDPTHTHHIDRARCRALLQLQSPVVARCRARSRRPSSRRAGRARGIIGGVEATEHVQRLAGGIDRLASACGLTAPQPGLRSAAREATLQRRDPGRRRRASAGLDSPAPPPVHPSTAKGRKFGSAVVHLYLATSVRDGRRRLRPSVVAARRAGLRPLRRLVGGSRRLWSGPTPTEPNGVWSGRRRRFATRPIKTSPPTGGCWVSGCGLNLRPTSGRLVRPPLLHIRRRWERILGSGER